MVYSESATLTTELSRHCDNGRMVSVQCTSLTNVPPDKKTAFGDWNLILPFVESCNEHSSKWIIVLDPFM